MEKDIHTQLNTNQRLNIRVSDLESQVLALTSQLSELDPNQASLTAQENARLRLELNEMAKQNEFLTTAT